MMKTRKKSISGRTKIGPHSQSKSFRRLDGRGRIARQIKAIEDSLIRQLGGPQVVSAGQRIVITALALRFARLQMLATNIAEDKATVECDRRIAWIANSISRDIRHLNLLKPEEEKESTLYDYLREMDGEFDAPLALDPDDAQKSHGKGRGSGDPGEILPTKSRPRKKQRKRLNGDHERSSR